MASQGGVLRGLAKVLLWLAGGFIAASALAVLALRWVPPLTTAFMVNGYLQARLAHDASWHLDYRWTAYERISRHAKLAVIAS